MVEWLYVLCSSVFQGTYNHSFFVLIIERFFIMTSVLTYADVKRPLANRNEIKGVANLEASNRSYVLNRRADALVKSVATCVELVSAVEPQLDKLSDEKRAEVEAALVTLRSF